MEVYEYIKKPTQKHQTILVVLFIIMINTKK